MKTKITKKLCGFFAAAFFLAALCASLGGCKIPSSDSISATPAGTINVKFGTSSDSPARTAVPDLASNVAVFVLTCTNTTTGASSTAEVSGSTTHQFTNVVPGSVTIGVLAYNSATVKDSTTLVATGSSTLTLAEGEGASVSVALAMASSGNSGGISLAIQWPATQADSVAWNLDSNAQAAPAVTTSGATSAATLIASSVSPGSHVMAITFKKGGTTVGTAIETVNVYANLSSEKWVDSTGNLASTRRFTTSDFGVSGAGMTLSVTAGTNTYAISFNSASSDIIWVPSGTTSISITPASGTAGENMQYTYNGSTVSIASGSTYAISALALPATITFSVTSADGTSTQGYSLTVDGATEISTVAQLSSTMSSNLDGHYVLTSDIVLPATPLWTPVGKSPAQSGTPFTGTFDGGGHSISNVSVSTATGDGGLFGYINSPAVISNVRLKNVAILSTIGNVSTDGVGGIVGENYGGTVTRCSVSGSISGKAWRVGGIVGNNRPGGIVSECYSTATVTTTGQYAGGLVGWNWGTIENCYSKGFISGNDSVGGIVDWNLSNTPTPTVINCYSASTVTYTSSGSAIGGLIAQNWGSCSDNYYDSIVSGCVISGNGTPKTSSEMKTQSTYSGWDFDSIWAIDPKKNNGYPYLKALPIPDDIVIPSGTGAAALYSLLNNNMDGDFVLADDLSLSGTWTHVGTLSAPFTGTFDGGDHTISNMTSDVSDVTTNPLTGMFGCLGAGGLIKNLHLTGINVGGLTNDHKGGLVSYNKGTIWRCSTSGVVTGDVRVGGLVGRNDGTVSECWSGASVTGTYSGSLVGENYGTIVNSYACGSVTAHWGGGLLGWNQNSGIVRNCYAAAVMTENGTILGDTSGGYFQGLIGQSTGTVLNSYNDSSKIVTSYYMGATPVSVPYVFGSPMPTASMQTSGTFSGWDFTNIWAIAAGTNSGYPYLINNAP